MSMVKAHMLYQLNLRYKDFGRLAVLLFGNLMQLRSVQVRYIFQTPKNEKFSLSHVVRSLWENFNVVELQHNHRQGEDSKYAYILNAISFGKHTEKDIELLRSRNSSSLPVEAVHLFGTNADSTIKIENRS